jgi:ribosomal protein L40E
MTPALATIALILLITVGYAAVCAAQPFAPCRRCGGLGFALKTNRRGKTTRGKSCRRCHATGLRIRIGRHLFNLYRHTRQHSR